MELGLATFADVNPGAGADRVAKRLKELLEEIELADRLGLEVFGVGEHHRPDYAVSATTVALAAAAARTEKIRLSSAVTVLSSADPVRVFQEFATLDLISNGRAEIMAGRGSFIESYPLFGFDLDDYDELFAEKLELLLQLRASERVTWSGKHRAPLNDVGVYPRPVQNPLPVWIAVGGTPASVARAGALGLPLMIAIIGGAPARFAPLVELYRESARRAEADSAGLAVGINSHMYLADTAQRARDEFSGVLTDDEPHRPRAGLAADEPCAVRRRLRARGSSARGNAGRRDDEDPRPPRTVRERPLPRPHQRRCAATREGDARDRAVRERGRAGRACGAGDLRSARGARVRLTRPSPDGLGLSTQRAALVQPQANPARP